MELTEKTIKEELIYKGRVFNVYNNTVTLPDGREAPREFIEHNGGVCVLPVCDNGDVILVKQFRYGIRNTLIEIPAGKLEKGENHKECGLRELKEEIGATPKEFIYLGECLPTTAYLSERIHMYLAKGLSFSEQHLDEDEFLEILRIPFEELLAKVISGEIKDAKTQIAVMKARMRNLV